jgi:hypothetical protein
METQPTNNGHHTDTVSELFSQFSAKDVRRQLFDLYAASIEPDNESMPNPKHLANSFWYVRTLVAFVEKLEAERKAYNYDKEESMIQSMEKRNAECMEG